MKFRFLVILIVFNLLNISNIYSQKLLDESDFESYYYDEITLRPTERIYLHNDKPYYFTGETIWFKLYCFDGSFVKPSSISRIAYVELLTDDHSPVFQEKILLENGTGDGYFFINSRIGSGIYTLRAYTSLMRNRDEGYFFEEEITIISPFKPNFDEAPSATGINISFYPEGGRLVQGLESRVAFQLNNNLGEAVQSTGFLVDELGNRVMELSSSERGIGVLSIIPEAGKQYKAIFNDGTKSYESALPSAESMGVVLNLDHQLINENVVIDLQSSQSGQVVYIAVHSRGILHRIEKRRFFEGKLSLDIMEEKLSDGINQITIFNEKFEPLAERLLFMGPGWGGGW
jgi:hypothetical protein